MELFYLGAATLVVYAVVTWKARSEVPLPHQLGNNQILANAQIKLQACQNGSGSACQDFYEHDEAEVMTQPSILPADEAAF